MTDTCHFSHEKGDLKASGLNRHAVFQADSTVYYEKLPFWIKAVWVLPHCFIML